ncbi:hypothetical protein EDD15DRAFT_2225466 [Pisolithus albus]|nr:hypothetical protein EDD15DRAFT_2225466 [Pisolithus albus]
MVSFQCSGCGDIVKKPKLDTHYARCHAPVDCIDCSTTFQIPAEFKSHTSCITEAEKYQKGLYKGPKVKQDQKQSRVKGKANGNGEQMKIDEQARDQTKEQPEKGDSAGAEDSAPAAPEPSKPSNSSEETTANTTSTKKPKDKKRKEKKSKSKDTTDMDTSKVAPSATIADSAPLTTPASAEKVVEPTGQKTQKETEGANIEESENVAMKDGDTKVDRKVEAEGGEKTEAKKSKRKKHKQKISDAAAAVVETNVAREEVAMEVDELKVATAQEKNEELKDKHGKKKHKDRSSAGTMRERDDKKTAAPVGDGEDAKDDSKKRKRGDEGKDKKTKKRKSLVMN